MSDAAEHHTKHGWPTTKNFLAPNGSSAEAENPCGSVPGISCRLEVSSKLRWIQDKSFC